MTRVLLFGTFDPLHKGHIHLFQEARALGDSLTVVVARDDTIRREKGREPTLPQDARVAHIEARPEVDEVLLGDMQPGEYQLLQQLMFDVLALGYDQQPSDEMVHELLVRLGKPEVQVVRLSAFRPDQYKSSLMHN